MSHNRDPERALEEVGGFWRMRFWPALILLGLSAPFWILLRGWFHARSLLFTLIGFASLIPFLFAYTVALKMSHVPDDSVLYDLLTELLWLPRLIDAAPLVGVACLIWLALALVYHLATWLSAPNLAPQRYSGGRFLLRPAPYRDTALELMLQWVVAAGIAAAIWLRPADVALIGLPIAPTEIRIGVAVNAAAFVALSGLVYLNRGSYPGFPAGAADRATTRAFRFVSRLRVERGKSEGLHRIFSRRDPALRRMIGGE